MGQRFEWSASRRLLAVVIFFFAAFAPFAVEWLLLNPAVHRRRGWRTIKWQVNSAVGGGKGIPMTRTMHGTVRGKTITFDEELGIPDGQQVEVVVTLAVGGRSWGDGIRNSAGAAAAVPGFDEAFAELERERKVASFRADEQ